MQFEKAKKAFPTFAYTGCFRTRKLSSHMVIEMEVSFQFVKMRTGSPEHKLKMRLQNKSYWQRWERRFKQSKPSLCWFPVQAYIAMALHLTRTYGFEPRESASSTREAIRLAIQGDQQRHPELQPIIEQAWHESPLHPAYQQAIETTQWLLGQVGGGEFLNDAQKTVHQGYVDITDPLQSGVLAAVPSTYHYAPQKERKRNEPFGTLGARGKLKLRLMKITEHPEGRYPATSYAFEDMQGRKFRWRASWPVAQELDLHQCYLLNATIKSHGEYREIHYTHLARCAKIVAIDKKEPTPPFSGKAKKQPSDSWLFKLLYHDTVDDVDEMAQSGGNNRLLIRRQWKQGKKAYQIALTFALPLPSNWLERINKELSQHGKPERVVDVILPKDKAFFNALHTTVERISQLPHHGNKTEFTIVDSPWHNLLSTQAMAAIPAPSFHFNREDAMTAAGEHEYCRLSTVQFNHINTLWIIAKHEISPNQKAQAKVRGLDLIVRLTEKFNVLESVFLQQENKVYPHLLIEQTLQYQRLPNINIGDLNIIALTGGGEQGNRDILLKMSKGESLSRLVKQGLLPDMVSRKKPYNIEGKVPLSFLLDERYLTSLRKQLARRPLTLIYDLSADTAQFLSWLGARVVTFAIMAETNRSQESPYIKSSLQQSQRVFEQGHDDAIIKDCFRWQKNHFKIGS